MTPEPYPTPWRWVDLGLPSGTLWLDRNVGANTPEDIGEYFTWVDASSWARVPMSLPFFDDAATYYYGNKMRMPSVDDCNELIENTTVSKEGLNYKLTSIVNGESILIPESGTLTPEGITLAPTVRVWTNTLVDETHVNIFLGTRDAFSILSQPFETRACPVRPIFNR